MHDMPLWPRFCPLTRSPDVWGPPLPARGRGTSLKTALLLVTDFVEINDEAVWIVVPAGGPAEATHNVGQILIRQVDGVFLPVLGQGDRTDAGRIRIAMLAGNAADFELRDLLAALF